MLLRYIKRQVVKYRTISLLPLCGKIFEKSSLMLCISHLVRKNLLTSNQSGFRPLDSCPNQLLYLVSEIHECFEDPKSLEVRAVWCTRSLIRKKRKRKFFMRLRRRTRSLIGKEGIKNKQKIKMFFYKTPSTYEESHNK